MNGGETPVCGRGVSVIRRRKGTRRMSPGWGLGSTQCARNFFKTVISPVSAPDQDTRSKEESKAAAAVGR